MEERRQRTQSRAEAAPDQTIVMPRALMPGNLANTGPPASDNQ
jgi:hypothetical protein